MKNKPVEYATIALISAKTNLIIQSAYTDSLGNFIIKTSNWNNCFLSIYSFGYNYKRIDLHDTNTNLLNIGNVSIEGLSSTLSEVTIVAQKEIIQTKVDRIVFNVEKLISLEGGTAIDALKKTPGVTVSNNNISISGKGTANIMINNKILNLSGENLVNYLQSISSVNIQKIEIISNPPSRYEAEGNAGLLNIVLKKQKNDGFNGTINNRYKQSFYGNWNSDASFYYVNKKLNIFNTIGYGKIHKRHLYNFNSTYTNFTSEEKGTSERKGDQYKTQFNLDYNITDKITIGTLFIGSFKNQTNDINNKIKFSDRNFNIDSLGNFTSTGEYTKYDYSINFHVLAP